MSASTRSRRPCSPATARRGRSPPRTSTARYGPLSPPRRRQRRRGRSELRVGARLREQAPEPDVWLCFAPLKKERSDLVAEKAGELSVSLLKPVFTARTNAARVNIERLGARAMEAAEQCGRLTVPAVRAPVDLAALLRDWPADRRPRILGKTDERGAPLLPSEGELSPTIVAEALVARLKGLPGFEALPERIAHIEARERAVAAEKAKIELSSTMTTDVNLPFIAAGPQGPVHLMRELARGDIERACRPLLDKLEDSELMRRERAAPDRRLIQQAVFLRLSK